MTDVSSKRTPSEQRSKYLDFLTLIYELPPKLVVLEAVEQRLLELITAHAYQGQPLSVMQILMSQEILFIGASTISRKIDLLRHGGWVHTVTDAKDRRVKYLYPSKKTLDHFERISALMAD